MKKSDAKAILIDDDLEFCGIFQKALETVAVRADFSVELAYRDRIEDDDQEIEDYDIYFVDIELGEKSGIELVAGMQRRNPGKEFIFVSAHEGYVEIHAGKTQILYPQEDAGSRPAGGCVFPEEAVVGEACPGESGRGRGVPPDSPMVRKQGPLCGHPSGGWQQHSAPRQARPIGRAFLGISLYQDT